MLNFADAAWDEVVGARAEAAQQHFGLLLHFCHMTHAASRQARRRPDEGLRAGGEGEDELHGIKLVRLQRHDSRCTERDDYFYGE